MKEFNEDKNKLSSYVPYICLVGKGVVLNSNGSFQKTLKYRGYDLDSCTAYEMQNITARLNDVIKRFGGEWSLVIEAQRKQSKKYNTIKDTKYKALEIIEKERKDNFFKNKHYESQYFLTLVNLIPKDSNEKIQDFFLEYATKKDRLDKSLEKFLKEFNLIKNLLDTIFLEVEELTDEETYTYLHSCVSARPMETVKSTEYPLCNF